jgi:hypothetical protein
MEKLLALLAMAVVLAPLAFLWARYDSTVRPRGLLGEVVDARRRGSWAVGYGRILVIGREAHGSDEVRFQCRGTRAHVFAKVAPAEARRIAAALREAAAPAGPAH